MKMISYIVWDNPAVFFSRIVKLLCLWGQNFLLLFCQIIFNCINVLMCNAVHDAETLHGYHNC